MLTSGDVYEFAIRGDANGVTHINVLHAILEADQTASAMQTASLALANAWKEVWRPQQSTSFTWQDFRAIQVAGAGVSYDATTCRRVGGDVYSGVLTGTLTGSIGGADPAASSLAVVAALRTGLVGRSFNGRTFVGGWSETNLNGNSMVATNLAILQTNLNNFLGVYGDGGTDLVFTWVVFSRFIASGCKYVNALPKPILTHVQAGDELNSYKPVKTASIGSLLAPMHRRKPGVGA